jgi:hypothetical protein
MEGKKEGGRKGGEASSTSPVRSSMVGWFGSGKK